MQAMRQDMQLGVLPGRQNAVHPDETVALVERQNRHNKLPGKQALQGWKRSPARDVNEAEFQEQSRNGGEGEGRPSLYAKLDD